MEGYFKVVWWLIVGYVLLGNYVYFRHVLPALRDRDQTVGPLLTPSGQFKQIDAYVSLLDESSTKPWAFHFLRHFKTITIALICLMVPLFIFVLRNAF
ncbi:hypothetical protein EV673_0211 [Limnobacter thiooxidans]|uniref:Uncharacterized protein n=1 Tax=Limnobacter thiooxidans TaxID=131080 RepID=A0AA86IZK6_9BURK|nr:hypothetical protein EV673_0211 [Limnobacter thiooxidans]BET26672.1 hypothetical protein RGQ30_21730 [Limnobacter thiooxidans]